MSAQLWIVPVTLREARAFVNKHHRHHRAPQGGLFAVGIASIHGFVGVAIVGRPVSRCLADDYTAEVTRLCVLDGNRHACSKLYAACWRAARAMGYTRCITYTLASESGVSVRAAGWKEIGRTRGGSWSRAARPRVDTHPTQAKIRWEIAA